MKKQIIKFNEPYSSNKIKKYVNSSLNSNYYSTGEYEHKVKKILKNKFNLSNTLITHSATGALELIALYLKKSHKNSKVFLPSYTFSSTANAFLRSGYKLKFLDVNSENLMIDLSKLPKMRPNDIVVPVHYSGHSVDFENISNVSKEHLIIEDAAQGLGTKWNNKQVGTFGEFSAFSFHHTKNFQSGFGGLMVSKYEDPMEILEYIYERGTDRSKVIAGLKNKYEWVEIGSSFQIPDLLSAVLLAQLEDYDLITSKRKSVVNFYNSYFENLSSELIDLPHFSDQSSTNYHAYFIKFKTEKEAKKFLNFTFNKGISCYIGYVPLHNSKLGKELKLNYKLPNTEFLGNKIVRLPVHTSIRREDLNYIKFVFDKFFKN